MAPPHKPTMARLHLHLHPLTSTLTRLIMQENLPFRIFYTGSYASLSILCVLVALVTPGDMIYQSYMSRNWKNIFIVIGVYVITALIAVFLYALRMWTNRKLLAEIPKAWIPIDKPDVAKKVHANIAFALARSAVVAQQSKPRDVEAEEEQEQDQGSSENVVIDPAWRIPKTGGPPPWGRVEHPGWTSPACRDLPGCEFAPVIAELPFVLEARAVSLAPPRGRLSPLQKEPAEVNEDVKGKGRAVDAETRASSRHVGEGGTGTGTGTDTPDGKIVQLLLRPKAMCLRDYMNHLVGLKMLKSPDIGRAFTRAYERCRFSGAPVTETDFRALMALFAQLLRAMVTPEPEALAQEVSGSSCQSNSRLSTTPSPSVSPLSPDVSEPDPAGDASTIKGKTPIYSALSHDNPSPSHLHVPIPAPQLSPLPPSSTSSSSSRFIINPQHTSAQAPSISTGHLSPISPSQQQPTPGPSNTSFFTPPQDASEAASNVSMLSITTAIRRYSPQESQRSLSRKSSSQALSVLERLDN